MPRGSHAPPAASTRPCSTQMAVGRGGGARPCLAIFQTCLCGLYLLWRFVISDLSCYCCEKTATHWGLGVSCQAQVTRILKTGRGSYVKPGVCPTSWLCQRWSLPGHRSLRSRGPESEQEATQSTPVPSEGERAGFQRLCLGLRLESRGLIVTPEALA